MDNTIGKKELKLPAKASIAYIFSGSVGKAVGFFATLVFTRMLTTEEYGALTLYLSWLGIAEAVSSVLISASVIYKGLSDFREEKRRFLSTVKLSFAAFSAVVCLLLFAFMRFSGVDTRLIPFIFLQTLFDGIATVTLAEKKHSYSYKAVAAMGIFDAVCSTLSSFLLIRYAKVGYFGRVLGYMIPSVILAVFTARRRGRERLFDFRILKYVLLLALPLLPHAISLAITSQTDKLIITSTLGREAAAKYSVVHSFGISGLFFVGALGSALGPWIQRKLRARKFTEITEITSTLISAFAAFSLFLIAVGPLAVAILAPPEYAVALPALAPISLSIIPYFAANINTVYLIFSEQGRVVSAAAVVSATVGVLSNLFFIRYFGYFGAGIGSLLSSTASWAVSAFYIKRRCECEILPTGTAIARIALALALSLPISMSYSRPYFIPLLLIPPAIALVSAAIKAKSAIFEK